MSKINELYQNNKQSIWYDFIKKSLLTSGQLQELLDEGLRGMTSNPSIFDNAISKTSDYDADFSKLVQEGKSVYQIYETLAINDISHAAELMRPLYDSSNAGDGFVSLEVDPTLAFNTEKTISEAKRLFTTLGHPNVMIKVPATEEGLPAITELIASGININVTLIFSLGNYQKVAEAYIKGLEILAENGPTAEGGLSVDKIGSVASFFVSRVDSAVDKLLQENGNSGLLGKIANANAKVSYDHSLKIFSDERWNKLAGKGARIQRVLWASTGTKNPDYDQLLYVNELIGPDTVNTVPPATYDRFKTDGIIKETVTVGMDEAYAQLDQLQTMGISLDKVTDKLQADGIASFANAFKSMIDNIAAKKLNMLNEKNFEVHLVNTPTAVKDNFRKLTADNIPPRIWEKDHSVWRDDPTEISNRLGWLESPQIMKNKIEDIQKFVGKIKSSPIKNLLLLGMGGSSMAPEVFSEIFKSAEGFPQLHVLDSTDAGAINHYRELLNPTETLYIVSTKSGGTVETLSLMKYFYTEVTHLLGADFAGDHFVAITDPGSGLEEMAGKLNFKKTFLNDPNIGGRYSVLTMFGLVPAALIGIDISKLLDSAIEIAEQSKENNNTNTSACLGTVMGTFSAEGRDKLTLLTSPQISHFGIWLEQLVAESIGKEGKGILPIDNEPYLGVDYYNDDRLFVYLQLDDDCTVARQAADVLEAGYPLIHIKLNDIYDLGAEFFRWEFATAVAGAVLNVQPFDQPNVESAKVAARKVIAEYQATGTLPEVNFALAENDISVATDAAGDKVNDILDNFFNNIQTGLDYLSLQAYITPTAESDALLQELRTALLNKYKVATTLGYGPRFLHSTGQLHKGDAGHGYFVQVVSRTDNDIAIPDEAGKNESAMNFDVLKNAQSMGDRQALLDEKRKVIRFEMSGDVIEKIKYLTEQI